MPHTERPQLPQRYPAHALDPLYEACEIWSNEMDKLATSVEALKMGCDLLEDHGSAELGTAAGVGSAMLDLLEVRIGRIDKIHNEVLKRAAALIDVEPETAEAG